MEDGSAVNGAYTACHPGFSSPAIHIKPGRTFLSEAENPSTPTHMHAHAHMHMQIIFFLVEALTHINLV